jgi:hypothetical protein
MLIAKGGFAGRLVMSPDTRRQIREDLDLMERFAQSYREQFATAIAELNGAPTAQTGERCLRLCVESVNMLLSMQDRMAAALKEIGV